MKVDPFGQLTDSIEDLIIYYLQGIKNLTNLAGCRITPACNNNLLKPLKTGLGGHGNVTASLTSPTPTTAKYLSSESEPFLNRSDSEEDPCEPSDSPPSVW